MISSKIGRSKKVKKKQYEVNALYYSHISKNTYFRDLGPFSHTNSLDEGIMPIGLAIPNHNHAFSLDWYLKVMVGISEQQSNALEDS